MKALKIRKVRGSFTVYFTGGIKTGGFSTKESAERYANAYGYNDPITIKLTGNMVDCGEGGQDV